MRLKLKKKLSGHEIAKNLERFGIRTIEAFKTLTFALLKIKKETLNGAVLSRK